jgi:hypothetical protein
MFAGVGKKGHWANSSPNYWRIVQEQCSPRLQNKSFDEQFGELFAELVAKMYGNFRDRT